MKVCKLIPTMSLKQKVWIFLILTCVVSTNAHKFRGCRVGQTGDGNWFKTNLAEFDCNKPKTNEFIRTKVYFRGKLPAMYILNGKATVIFGMILWFLI